MAKKTNLELLQALGAEVKQKKKTKLTRQEERVIAGFEEIQSFVEKNGKFPEHGESRDIFERLYAVRLDQIIRQPEFHELLTEIDHQGLLKLDRDGISVNETNGIYLTDNELLDSLGVEANTSNSISDLKYVKPRAEINAATEVAQRAQCKDFEKFQPIFDSVQTDLKNGIREAKLLTRGAFIDEGDLFILHGQKLYIADGGKEFVNKYGRKDRRLRVIYDNGTESAILFRSLQRALEKDESGRRIIKPSAGPLFADIESEEAKKSGTIYILRSNSSHPFIKENRNVLHKIGVTSGDVKTRIAKAKSEPTYLMAEVEVVAEYDLAGIHQVKFEKIVHTFFRQAQLQIDIPDRFGNIVSPKEWFLVPLNAIDELIQRIRDNSVLEYIYDAEKAVLVQK